ncbi:hypothetical protein [Mycobacterium sp. HM-7]
MTVVADVHLDPGSRNFQHFAEKGDVRRASPWPPWHAIHHGGGVEQIKQELLVVGSCHRQIYLTFKSVLTGYAADA